MDAKELAREFIRESLGHPNFGLMHLREDIDIFLSEEHPDAKPEADNVMQELEALMVKPGDTLIARRDIRYFMGQVDEDKVADGERVTVERTAVLSHDGRMFLEAAQGGSGEIYVYLEEHPDRYGPFPLSAFRLIV